MICQMQKVSETYFDDVSLTLSSTFQPSGVSILVCCLQNGRV